MDDTHDLSQRPSSDILIRDKNQVPVSEQQPLEFLLVSENRDFVIGPKDSKKQVSELYEKQVYLFFSAKHTEEREQFMSDLIATYEELRDEIEVIYISCDINEGSFKDFYAKMPWLALPYGDEKQNFLLWWFEIDVLSQLISVSPTGQTVAIECREMLETHLTTAYPFDEDCAERVWSIKYSLASGYPKKVKSNKHQEHDLELMYKTNEYQCFDCSWYHFGWGYCCVICNLSFNPACVIRPGEDEARVEEVLEDEAGVEEVLEDEAGVEEVLEDEAGVEEVLEDEARVEEVLEDEARVEEVLEDEARVEEVLEDQGNNHEENNNAEQIGHILLLMIHLIIFIDNIVLLMTHLLAIFLDFTL